MQSLPSIDRLAFYLQVSVFLERQGQKVEGVGMWGAWNDEIWAAFPDGTKKCLWRAGPLHVTSSK